MKKTILLLLALTVAFAISTGSCSTSEPSNNESGDGPNSTISVDYDADDLDSSSGATGMTHVRLAGNAVTMEGSGARVNGNIITITSAGTYSISGILDEGQIVVYTQDNAVVNLVLNGAAITCSASAPIYVINADKTVLTLAEGTENYITDGSSYILGEASSDEPNAAIFSKDDLTINGAGSLTVKGNYNDGIASKDDLKIIGGSITVNAVNDGIKGRDRIAIKDGTISVRAGSDGMQSNNDEDPEKGFVLIEGGTISIIAGADGIQAETSLMISSGSIVVSSGGGSSLSSADTAKGLKAGVSVTIEGGSINIDSADDCVHSNGSITINGGQLRLASSDDAIHADSTIEISGGNINITRCYEGIEGGNITINDGNIRLVSSDDGINAVSDDGGAPVTTPPGPGQARPGQSGGNNHLYINGGYIVIDALGDGLDINGPVYMAGGSLIINGPVRNDNGALDYAGVFEITRGFLVAVGSAGMAQAPSQSSSQSSMALRYTSPQAAGAMIHIETADGEGLLTFVPTKAYQSVVFSSPQLRKGSTYVVYAGGSSTGTVTDGLYSGGTYTPGTKLGSVTL